MADSSIDVDPGTGTTKVPVATETGSDGKDYQKIILTDATDPVANQLVVSSAGAAKVDGSAVTQPVSLAGNVTVIQATASNLNAAVTDAGGSLTVDSPQLPAALAAGGGMKVEGVAGGVAVPVSAASLPLPSGASTAAKQPALGTAGAASADVLSIQGVASMTAVKVDGSAVTQPVSGTVTANIGTTNGLALDATLTGGTQKTKLVDTGGTNVASISAAGALKMDGSAVTQPVSIATAPVLVAGAAVIGKVGIDQTTPGTTNGVQVNAALPAGTNNIGDVDVLSIAAGDNNIGNVDIVTQPARAATADNIGAKLATDAIMNGTTALTPKFAVIDAAGSGNNTLVAAVSSKKIRVLSLFVVAAGTTTVRFESGADGTALTGQMNLIANVGFVLPFNPVGWFETAATTLLNMELSAAISVDGSLVYVEV